MKTYGPTNLPSPYRVFPTGGWGEKRSPPTSRKFAHSPPPRKLPPNQKSIPPPCPTKQRFSSYFNFILFGHIADVNFDLNWCSAFTENRFQLWKRFESSKSFLIRFPSSSKKISPPPSVKFQIPHPHPHPLPLFGKPCHRAIYFSVTGNKFSVCQSSGPTSIYLFNSATLIVV